MNPKTEKIRANLSLIKNILDLWGFVEPASPARAIKRSHILSWLENFKPSEISDALCILSKIQYKNDHSIRQAISSLSIELSNTLGHRMNDAALFPLGRSPSSSGGMYLYDFRKDLGLSEANFPTVSIHESSPESGFLIFFDDIIGSGNQAVQFYREYLRQFPNRLIYVALFAFETGINNVLEKARFEHVIVGHRLSDEERAFSANSEVFPEVDTRKRIKDLCLKYGSKLYPRHPLGYDDSQALLVFPHNTPNNTLPIIWAGPRNEKPAGVVWYPVWERRKGKRSEVDTQALTARLMLSRLPTTSNVLFGRTKELRALDQAWADDHIHILSIVAWGGVGKTALVNEWLNVLSNDNYHGIESLYGWSFYSQGQEQRRRISADVFFANALDWFGDPDPKRGSPWNKGIRLAELVRKRKVLLILDGLEPLQYPSGAMGGYLRDQGIQALLKELARLNEGLCLITTRVSIEDLRNFEDSTLRVLKLDHLDANAGAQLLRFTGVRSGTDDELRRASDEYGGHALALSLLGRYISIVHDGEIKRRHWLSKMTEEEGQGGHALRVMKSYEQWLDRTEELDVLYLLGLFDRPAEKGAIDRLRANPPIIGISPGLFDQSNVRVRYAIRRLRDMCLVAEIDEYHNSDDHLDCHPLIREYFGERLREKNPDAWQEAHSRLYEYYKDYPDSFLPDSLEDMGPLFAAVTHGCRAGRHQEVVLDVYWERINRKLEFFSLKVLGAFGETLAALSEFFDTPWNKLNSNLDERWRAGIFGHAGYGLRGLGLYQDALQAMHASLAEAEQVQGHMDDIAQCYQNISEMYLVLGDISEAVKYAESGLAFADKSGAFLHRKANRTTLANALSYAGKEGEAKRIFAEAEALHKDSEPDEPYLPAQGGFHFCDLLLSQGQYQEVRERAIQTRELAIKRNIPLYISLDNLSIGRSFLLQAEREGLDLPTETDRYIEHAVNGIRNAGQQQYLPLALLARATLFRLRYDLEKALLDLKEMRDITLRGGMKIYLVDYYVESCKLLLSKIEKRKSSRSALLRTWRDAVSLLSDASRLAQEIGYRRIDPMLRKLEKYFETRDGRV